MNTKTKYLFISLDIQDGERTYHYRVLETTKCKDINFAGQWYAAHFWSDLTWCDRGSYYFTGGEVAVRLEKIKEVTKEEYDLLTKLFYN